MTIPWDWSPYLMGGGARADAISGMNPAFSSALQSLFMAAPDDVRSALRVNSGYRSNERQAQLWDEALAKYGTPELARKWVAPPGSSQHNHGNAADLKYLSPEAKAWARENAAAYGLSFPLNNEDWHIELASARGDAPKLQFSTPEAGGIIPFSLGTPVADATTNPLAQSDGLLQSLAAMQPEAPEIAPRQVVPYTPVRRENTSLLQFLASLR